MVWLIKSDGNSPFRIVQRREVFRCLHCSSTRSSPHLPGGMRSSSFLTFGGEQTSTATRFKASLNSFARHKKKCFCSVDELFGFSWAEPGNFGKEPHQWGQVCTFLFTFAENTNLIALSIHSSWMVFTLLLVIPIYCNTNCYEFLNGDKLKLKF